MNARASINAANDEGPVPLTTLKPAETDAEIESTLTDVLDACSGAKEANEDTKPRPVHSRNYSKTLKNTQKRLKIDSKSYECHFIAVTHHQNL